VQSEPLSLPSPTFTEIAGPISSSRAGTITIRIKDAIVEISGDASPSAIEAIMRVLVEKC